MYSNKLPLFTLLLTLISVNFISAQNMVNETTARIEFVIPTPDPVPAGEKINFQVTLFNTSKNRWLTNTYAAEIEIYNTAKKYLMKTDLIYGKELVLSDRNTTITVPYIVPTNFAGEYYFRVGFYMQKQRIVYSDYANFTVVATALPPTVKLSGNTTISYKNSSLNNWKSYIGNVNLSLLGSIYNNAVVSNVYTYHTIDKPLDWYNLQLELYNDKLELSFGDSMPYFTNLTVSNLGIMGIYPRWQLGAFHTSLLIGRSIVAKEGTDTTIGTYPRYVYGVNEKINLPLNTSITFTYVQNKDEPSLTKLGPPGTLTLPLANNTVWGANVNLGILKFFTLTYDYAASKYFDNKPDSIESKDSAYSISGEGNLLRKLFTFKLKYLNTGKDFVTLSNPSIVKDRVTYEAATQIRVKKVGGLSFTYMKYRDNISNQYDKLSALQHIWSVSPVLSIPKLPVLNLFYSLNTAVDESVSYATDNRTQIYSVGISQMLTRWFTFSVRTQQSTFQDNKKPDNNRDSVSGTVGIVLNFQDQFTFNSGLTYIESKMVSNQTRYNSLTLSLTGNYKLIPTKLMLNFWGDVSKKDELKYEGLITNTLTFTPNLEITYYFNPLFGLSLSMGGSAFKDNLQSEHNIWETRTQTRINLGF